MTHEEYEKKRLALLSNYLYAAAVADAGLEQADDLAHQLAHQLDRLALQIDPFAGDRKEERQ
jgi:hypothetical protein